MLKILQDGGPVLWVIIALSFFGVIIVLERLLFFRKINVDEDKLFLRIKTTLQKGHFEEAMSICDNNVSPLSSLIKVGIEYREYPESTQKDVLKDAASQEIPQLEKHLASLASITQIAPLLGLLGTVTGIMKAFDILGSMNTASDPKAMAGGIAEALITTVAGIVVAVPAVVFYNYLVDRVNRILIKMENQVNELILMINSTRTERRTTSYLREGTASRVSPGQREGSLLRDASAQREGSGGRP